MGVYSSKKSLYFPRVKGYSSQPKTPHVMFYKFYDDSYDGIIIMPTIRRQGPTPPDRGDTLQLENDGVDQDEDQAAVLHRQDRELEEAQHDAGEGDHGD